MENEYMPRQQAPLSLEFILLGFLEQKPIHGYDLYKQISSFDAISLVWSVKQSQLYALL
jgi:DNA-binding PadR family transcriptional regulator